MYRKKKEKKPIQWFSFSTFKIAEYKCAQFIQRCKKSFSFIHFRKFLHKLLQIRITGDHKCSDRDLQFFALCSKVQAAVHYFAVEAKTIFIIFFPDLQTGWFTIGDHKNLLVGILSPAQYIHRMFKPLNSIGL